MKRFREQNEAMKEGQTDENLTDLHPSPISDSYFLFDSLSLLETSSQHTVCMMGAPR